MLCTVTVICLLLLFLLCYLMTGRAGYQVHRSCLTVVACGAPGDTLTRLFLPPVAMAYAPVMLAVLFAVLVGVILYLLYRSRQRLAEQALRLEVLERERKDRQQALEGLSALLAEQGEAREQVAKGLHEELSGQLAGVRQLVSRLLLQAVPMGGKEQVAHILFQLDSATKELRMIAQEVMPEALLRSGLLSALQALCERLSRNGRTVICRSALSAVDIPRPVQLHIYQLVAELLTYAAGDASATRVVLACEQREGELSITVVSDGGGFDPAILPANAKEDWQHLQRYLQYLDGQLRFSTVAAGGTAINILCRVCA